MWGIDRPAGDAGSGYTHRVHSLSPILVAEDDDDDFHFVRHVARAANINNAFLRFRDGSELTRYLDSLRTANTEFPGPWLLLLDLGMPIMNGFEVLEWLQHYHVARVRPVILSGFYHEGDIQRCRDLGATDYVVKPLRAETIATLLKQPVAA